MPSVIRGYKDYTCRQGDMFDLLAGQAYGQEYMSSTLIMANPDYADVVMFDGGESIRIPIVEVVERPDTLPPWRR